MSHTHSAQRTSSNDEVSSLSAWHRCRFRFWCYTVECWKFAWRPICVLRVSAAESTCIVSYTTVAHAVECHRSHLRMKNGPTRQREMCSSSLLLLAVFFHVEIFLNCWNRCSYITCTKINPRFRLQTALIFTRFVFKSVRVQVVMCSMPKRKSSPSNEIKQQILRSRCNCSRCTKLDHSQVTTTA